VAILDILTFLKMNPEIVPVPSDSIGVTPEFYPAYNSEFIYNAGLDHGRFGEVYSLPKYGPNYPSTIESPPTQVTLTKTYPTIPYWYIWPTKLPTNKSWYHGDNDYTGRPNGHY